jgi:hypothetical protein
MRYAYRRPLGWYKETVEAIGDVSGDASYHTSLALDGSNYPRISYCDGGKGDLKYAYPAGLPASELKPHSVNPSEIRLLSIRPNPATTQTSVLYSIGAMHDCQNRLISLQIFDTLGRFVATPIDHMAPSGTNSIQWNLRSDNGAPVPSGVYYLQIQAENPELGDVGRLVVVR